MREESPEIRRRTSAGFLQEGSQHDKSASGAGFAGASGFAGVSGFAGASGAVCASSAPGSAGVHAARALASRLLRFFGAPDIPGAPLCLLNSRFPRRVPTPPETSASPAPSAPTARLLPLARPLRLRSPRRSRRAGSAGSLGRARHPRHSRRAGSSRLPRNRRRAGSAGRRRKGRGGQLGAALLTGGRRRFVFRTAFGTGFLDLYCCRSEAHDSLLTLSFLFSPGTGRPVPQAGHRRSDASNTVLQARQVVTGGCERTNRSLSNLPQAPQNVQG